MGISILSDREMNSEKRNTDLGSVAVIPKPPRQGLGAVIFVREHGDKNPLCSSAGVPGQTGLLGQLELGAEVVNVRDAEVVCQDGGAGFVDLGGLGGAENDTPPYRLAGLVGDGVAAGVAEVVEAGEGDEGGAGESVSCC